MRRMRGDRESREKLLKMKGLRMNLRNPTGGFHVAKPSIS